MIANEMLRIREYLDDNAIITSSYLWAVDITDIMEIRKIILDEEENEGGS